MAPRKGSTKKPDPDNIFTTSEGVRVKLTPVDAIFIQTVIRSVEDIERPTYTQYIGFNKRPNEVEIKDEITATQVEEDFPGTLARWKEYEEDRDNASAERNNRSLKAIFMSGTECPDNDDWVTSKWMTKLDFIGIDIPEEREHAWVLFLLTNHDGDEILAISQKIMRLTGVPEDVLASAEDTFQSAIQDDSGTE